MTVKRYSAWFNSVKLHLKLSQSNKMSPAKSATGHPSQAIIHAPVPCALIGFFAFQLFLSLQLKAIIPDFIGAGINRPCQIVEPNAIFLSSFFDGLDHLPLTFLCQLRITDLACAFPDLSGFFNEQNALLFYLMQPLTFPLLRQRLLPHIFLTLPSLTEPRRKIIRARRKQGFSRLDRRTKTTGILLPRKTVGLARQLGPVPQFRQQIPTLTDRMVLGGALLDLAGRNEGAAAMVDRLLRNLPREQDRKAFDGWKVAPSSPAPESDRQVDQPGDAAKKNDPA